MRYLTKGLVGQDVASWQQFLRGIMPNDLIETGVFDDNTVIATQLFQRFEGLRDDGIVGNATMGAAMRQGYNPLDASHVSTAAVNFPPRPTGFVYPTELDRRSLFGDLKYKPAPTQSNPEAITVDQQWIRDNIVKRAIKVQSRTVDVSVNARIAHQFTGLFEAWSTAGLLNRILTFDGMWVPRFVRGSRTTLSAHAWGTAFDINAQWNGLGCKPALVGDKGSVRELVEIAYQYGFCWGGHISPRPDGMHVEAVKIQ